MRPPPSLPIPPSISRARRAIPARVLARQRHEDVYSGTDFIKFADDGRIARVTMFYDSTPEGAQTA